jgi:hypothetical protein
VAGKPTTGSVSAVWLGREDGRGRSGTGGQIGGEPEAAYEGHREGEVRRWRSTLDDDDDAAVAIGYRRQDLGGDKEAVLGASDVILAADAGGASPK